MLDESYPLIITECARAMEAIRPEKRAHKLQRRGCVEVSMYRKHWPCYFPQHGPGRKHERPITLAPWQEVIVEAESEALVRGLIHSDGCRIAVMDRKALSVRYHFSNLSDDIKGIFCQALDRLEIPWTRPRGRQIAVIGKWQPRAWTSSSVRRLSPR